MPSLIDTHAHFCDAQFAADRLETLRRAAAAGIAAIVEIADAPAGWEAARRLSESSSADPDLPAIYWACGFHPHYAAEQRDADFGIMTEILSSRTCLAVGEIGLDYVKSAAPKETQISLFRKTLEVAAEAGRPVIIHCREAQADMLRILKSFFGGTARRDAFTGVIHCFSGDRNFAEGCLDLGFCLGVDGPLTYPSAKNLRETISRAPLDRIVLETDAPYLPPQPFRGKRNESAYLPHVAERLAELFAKPADEIAAVTSDTARKLFRIPHAKTG